MRTVNLVATEEAIARYFPDARASSHLAVPGIMSAEFPIFPETCRTQLGRWLAGAITTTRFDDDASMCRLVLPATEIGLHIHDLGERLRRSQEVRTQADAERIFVEIEGWIESQRKKIKVYGRHAFTYRSVLFQWPVFGSAAAEEARTPEAYFDLCAGRIRATGGIIVEAGLGRDVLPESLLRTTAPKRGGGDLLLKRYRA